MRIYQLAKEIGVAGTEVLGVAAAKGFDAETVLSSLAADEAREIKAEFAKRDPAAAKAARESRAGTLAAKAAKAAEMRSAARAERDAALAEHLRRAEEAAAAAGLAPSAPTPPPSAPAPKKAAPAPKPAKKKKQEQAEPIFTIGTTFEDNVGTVKADIEDEPQAEAPAPADADYDDDEIDDPAALRALRNASGSSKYQAAHAPRAKKDSKEKEEKERSADQARRQQAPQSAAPRKAAPGKPLPRSTAAAPAAAQPAKAASAQPKPPRSSPRAGFQQVSITSTLAQPKPGALPQKPGISISAKPQIHAAPVINVNTREISIRGATVVKDLAAKLGIRPNRLIADLMQLKVLASINQRVEPAVAEQVAQKYGFKVTIEHVRDRGERKPVLKAIDADDAIPEDPPESMQPRPPVVTFLGHVDHGKTTLMDYIRHTKVAAGEAGGITQKISAYQVEINGRKITFLDTPGHAAFSAMRQRGASLTDIAVIIIAADDGIMPQTQEAIKDARQAGVQIMIAITKCDLPTANTNRVKQMLQKEGLTPEEWGGDVVCCEVSGVTGDGVDNLLEMMLLQADVLELSANPGRRANGYVVEAQLEQGFGPSAMMLVTGGTLKVGDAVLVGETFGKVRSLIDDHGRRVREAGPSTPVKVTGLSGVPEAGAEFRVMLDEKRARTLAADAALARKTAELSTARDATSLDSLLSKMQNGDKRELNVVVKADTRGSLEAVVEALNGIKSEKVALKIIGESAGNVSLTDVKDAAAGKAVIVGFDVGTDSGVQQQARHDGVRINTFRIIYELIDHVKKSMLDLLPPEYKEAVKGHAAIKAVYDIGKVGRIAGCQMLDGSLLSTARYRVFRDGAKLWEGKLTSLKHFKDEVKEVTGQQECGVCLDGFEKFQEGDTLECYLLEELPRSL